MKDGAPLNTSTISSVQLMLSKFEYGESIQTLARIHTHTHARTFTHRSIHTYAFPKQVQRRRRLIKGHACKRCDLMYDLVHDLIAQMVI